MCVAAAASGGRWVRSAGSSSSAPPRRLGVRDAALSLPPSCARRPCPTTPLARFWGPLAYYGLDDTRSAAVDGSPNGLDGTLGKTTGEAGAGFSRRAATPQSGLPGPKTGWWAFPWRRCWGRRASNVKFLSSRHGSQVATVIFAYRSDVRSVPYDVFIKNAKLNAPLHLSSVARGHGTSALSRRTPRTISSRHLTGSHFSINGVQVKATALAARSPGMTARTSWQSAMTPVSRMPRSTEQSNEVTMYAKPSLTANDVRRATPRPAATRSSGYIDWSTSVSTGRAAETMPPKGP